MSLKIKYVGVFLYMVIVPMLIKLTPYPFSLIWCLAYGLLLGNILYYSYNYQKE